MASIRRGRFPIHHDSAPLVQWQSGRCSLTNQASPGQAPGEPFGGDPFPLPVFLPGMEGTDEHRASIIVVHYTVVRTTCQGQSAKLLNFLSVKKTFLGRISSVPGTFS